MAVSNVEGFVQQGLIETRVVFESCTYCNMTIFCV